MISYVSKENYKRERTSPQQRRKTRRTNSVTALFKLHGVSKHVFAYGTLIFLSQWKHKRCLYLFPRLYLGKRGRTGTIATAGWTRANWTVYSSSSELLRVWHLHMFNLVIIESARGIDFCSMPPHQQQQQKRHRRRRQQQQQQQDARNYTSGLKGGNGRPHCTTKHILTSNFPFFQFG